MRVSINIRNAPANTTMDDIIDLFSGFGDVDFDVDMYDEQDHLVDWGLCSIHTPAAK